MDDWIFTYKHVIDQHKGMKWSYMIQHVNTEAMWSKQVTKDHYIPLTHLWETGSRVKTTGKKDNGCWEPQKGEADHSR